jgi:mutator protein MutT
LVGGVVVQRGRVLLGLRRSDRASFPGVWDVPGGHVEPGEAPRQALLRELREELGIDAVVEEPWRRLVDDALTIDLTLWLVRDWRGDIENRAPHEHERLEWFAARDLDALPLAHPVYVSLLGRALGR